MNGIQGEAFNDKNNLKIEFISSKLNIRCPEKGILTKSEILQRIDSVLNNSLNMYNEEIAKVLKVKLATKQPLFKLSQPNREDLRRAQDPLVTRIIKRKLDFGRQSKRENQEQEEESQNLTMLNDNELKDLLQVEKELMDEKLPDMNFECEKVANSNSELIESSPKHADFQDEIFSENNQEVKPKLEPETQAPENRVPEKKGKGEEPAKEDERLKHSLKEEVEEGGGVAPKSTPKSSEREGKQDEISASESLLDFDKHEKKLKLDVEIPIFRINNISSAPNLGIVPEKVKVVETGTSHSKIKLRVLRKKPKRVRRRKHSEDEEFNTEDEEALKELEKQENEENDNSEVFTGIFRFSVLFIS